VGGGPLALWLLKKSSIDVTALQAKAGHSRAGYDARDGEERSSGELHWVTVIVEEISWGRYGSDGCLGVVRAGIPRPPEQLAPKQSRRAVGKMRGWSALRIKVFPIRSRLKECMESATQLELFENMIKAAARKFYILPNILDQRIEAVS
jgi:hypothetical protein